MRRTLRIFPIYYLTIFVLLLFSKSTGTNIKADFLYYFTYTSNFLFFKTKEWDGIISHLWTLAVEEQFYLIWPWIILFINRKYLLHSIGIFILIGIVSQYLLSGIKMYAILTFACFDSFGLGALLAWIITYAKDKIAKFYSSLSVITLISTFLFILNIFWSEWLIPFRTIVSIMALWAITYIVLHHETNSLKFKIILNNKMLIFLGKISYGIYLYHNIVPKMLNSKIIDKYFNPLLPDLLNKKYWKILILVENFILVVVVSWLSFVLIEKSFLSLKKYFEFPNKSRAEQKVLRKQVSKV